MRLVFASAGLDVMAWESTVQKLFIDILKEYIYIYEQYTNGCYSASVERRVRENCSGSVV